MNAEPTARLAPNTALANGSVVPDFFAVGFAAGLLDAGFVAPADAGRYAGALLAPYAFGF